MLQVLKGENVETSDFYALKKENEKLRAQLEIYTSKGFDVIATQIQNMLKNGGVGVGGGAGSSDQIQKLIADNAEMRELLIRLLEGGDASTMRRSMSIGGGYSHNDPRFRDPTPKPDEQGLLVEEGISHRFGGMRMPVVDSEGKRGINKSNLFEHAFLQLQLVESFEREARKDEALKQAN